MGLPLAGWFGVPPSVVVAAFIVFALGLGVVEIRNYREEVLLTTTQSQKQCARLSVAALLLAALVGLGVLWWQ